MSTPTRKEFSPPESLGAKASSVATCDTRNVTRTARKSQKRRKNDEATASTETTVTVNEVQVARSRRASRYVAGRRGKLKLMTEMPIDTLHEVFRRLDPVDLLHLSWASKRLRSLIMERPARYIWQEAFERLYASNNPPPRCPEDIEITKYTRFLFNKKCMICGIGNGHWTSWTMRLRTCSDCIVDHFTRRTLAPQYDNKLPLIVARNGKYFLKRDIADAEANGLSVDKFKSKSHDLESFCSWQSRCVINRKNELDSIRLERKKAIFRKLEEIGWKQSDIEKITRGAAPLNIPGLNKTKKLTDKEWHEIKPRILKYLGGQQEFHETLMKWWRSENRWGAFKKIFTIWQTTSQTLPQSLVPLPVDIAVLEPFKSTIFLSDAETADFSVDAIDCAAKEWMSQRDAFVFSLFPREIQDRYQVEDFQHSLYSLLILRLSGPHSLLTGTVDHICGSRQSARRYDDLQDPNEKVIRKLVFEHCRVEPWIWNSQDISFDTKAFEIGKDVITFLGLDPYTTTFGDLVQCHRKFTCLSKHPADFVSRELNGVEMLEHDYNLHEEDWTPAAERWQEV